MNNDDVMVYIAAPFFTEEQLRVVMRVEAALFALGIKFYSPRADGVLKDMDPEEQASSRRRIFDLNIANMNACTHTVACVEHKDSGTTFEIGFQCASKKPIILFSEKMDLINVMLAESAFALCDKAEMLEESINGLYTVKIGEVI